MKKIEFASEEEWLTYRRSHIMSTDVAAIAGLTRSIGVSPLAVYVNKKRGEEVEVNERMILGRHTQRGIAEAYREIRMKREGVQIAIEHSPHWCVWEADDSRFAASWDCVQAIGDDIGVLEIKSTGGYPNEPYDSWVCQVLWQMMCSGYSEATIAASCGGDDVRWWEVEYDEEAVSELVRLASEFWDRLERGDPPPAEGDGKAVGRLFRKAVGGEVVFDLYDLDLVLERNDKKAEVKVLESRIDEIESALKEKMGEAPLGYLPDGSRIVWENRDAVLVPAHTRKATRHFQIYPPRAERRKR